MATGIVPGITGSVPGPPEGSGGPPGGATGPGGIHGPSVRRDQPLGGLGWRKYALEAIIKLLFISLYHDKSLLFMLELY